ncbi:LLM class flavin-dependent oxidoreductase [Mycetocola tolaasinivorans]|uniref:LLM class flavin-dependent oxidoreductase n=1 Tax=Mycetocola tolaasinivorans TaxID=76635 RepID=A0A3L7A949_9MICO|nr:LLM class flavin-dependent oxidoreductase [Mycetocola tolaasinivorans]RLP76869.1 LLM class flavin-dependent oxidoreductase [Mycetocola tolaasinivorans]
MTSFPTAAGAHASADTAIPLSVLDLVLISEGGNAASALREAVVLAQTVESAGYRRYWVAEHHLFPGGAGSASYLLTPTIAQATSALRVGTAVIIVDNHTPLQVAEIAGTVATLTGRPFDLGIGRGGPTADQVARGRQTNAALEAGTVQPGPVGEHRVDDGVVIPSWVVAPFIDVRAELNNRLLNRYPGNPTDFGEQVDDILGFLRGTFTPPENVPVTATPAEGADVEVWVHGSSAGVSAEVAGANGLRFGANYHALPQNILATVQAYRDAFVPSAELAEPYVAVSVDVLVADTDEEAQRLAKPFERWLHTIRTTYVGTPYLSPETDAANPLTAEEALLVSDRVASRIVGSPETVVSRLKALRDATGADEFVITTQAHSLAVREHSYRLLSEFWR